MNIVEEIENQCEVNVQVCLVPENIQMISQCPMTSIKKDQPEIDKKLKQKLTGIQSIYRSTFVLIYY